MRISDWSSDVCSSDLFTHVQTVADGETIKLGDLRLTAHFTGGHTPGGTSWSWKSCEGRRCADMVYADSLTAVSAPDFHFSANNRYASVLKDFEHSFRTIAALDCDILLTPHPDASAFWQRSEEHTSDLQSLMRISYAFFCFKK